MIIALLAGSLMLSGPAVLAQDADVSVKVADKEKKVCRRETVVGSRLARKVCLTKAQWAAIDRQNRDENGRIIDNSEREGRDAFNPGPQPAGGGGR